MRTVRRAARRRRNNPPQNFHALAREAPREIQPDVEMFARALDLARANDTTALEAQRANIVAATRRLDDYLADTCGLETVTVTT